VLFDSQSRAISTKNNEINSKIVNKGRVAALPTEGLLWDYFIRDIEIYFLHNSNIIRYYAKNTINKISVTLAYPLELLYE
jgi:hypothetical protein